MTRSFGGDVLATLVPMALVSIVLAACNSTAPPPSGETTESLVPRTSTAAADPLGLGNIDWVYTPPPVVTGGPGGSYTLQAGTLADDGPIVDLEVPWRAELGDGIAREPAIGAPHGGWVVYVADDGAESEIRRAEIAADGRNEPLATLHDVIWDIAVVPDGSAAYAAVVDRADTTRDRGVVRILLDGSGSVEPVLPPAPLGAVDDVRRLAILAFQVSLTISSDGQYLLRRTCAEAGSCLVEAAELATGRVIDLADREVLGIASGVIVARRCDDRGCGLEAMNVKTGATASGGVDVFGPVVEVGEDPLVVAVAAAGGLTTVEGVNPASGRASVLYRVPEGAQVSYGDFLDLQMDVPDGFVHIVEMTPIGKDGAVIRVDERHLLISVVEGRAIEIPRPAYRQPPGFGTQG